MPTYLGLMASQVWLLASFFLSGSDRFAVFAISVVWMLGWLYQTRKEERAMSQWREEMKYVALPVLVKKITQRAVLINLSAAGDHWIPQSCIATHSLAELGEGFLGDIDVAEWFVKKEGLV